MVKERIVGPIHGPVGGESMSWLVSGLGSAMAPLREWGPGGGAVHSESRWLGHLGMRQSVGLSHQEVVGLRECWR